MRTQPGRTYLIKTPRRIDLYPSLPVWLLFHCSSPAEDPSVPQYWNLQFGAAAGASAFELPPAISQSARNPFQSAAARLTGQRNDDVPAYPTGGILEGGGWLDRAAQPAVAPMPDEAGAIAHLRQGHANRFERGDLIAFVEMPLSKLGPGIEPWIEPGGLLRARARTGWNRPDLFRDRLADR